MQAAATYYSHIISENEYQEAIRAAGRLTPNLLRKFLTLELTLSATVPTDVSDDPPDFVPWSKIIARDDTKPVISQTLIALTEFDPRKAIYRDGEWVSDE